MNNLLLKLEGNPYINKSAFHHKLFLFDDILLYRKRKFFRVKEVTIAYSHIVQVDVISGIIFSSISILNPATDTIEIKGVPNKLAKKAKKIIDQKIHMAHAKHSPAKMDISNDMVKYEKSLNRLDELLQRGMITDKEYNERRSDLMDRV